MVHTDHFIKFVSVDSTVAPVEVQCSCGTKLPAKNGTDAMLIARVHIEGERTRELSETA